MTDNLLQDGDFEAEWSPDNGGHTCFVYDIDGGEPEIREIGNIFVPPGWKFYFFHNPGEYDQPEGRDARTADRVRSGDKAWMFFTFNRRHWAGLYQQVQVEEGQRLRFTAYAHAWSNHCGVEDGGHPGDPAWSDGAGYEQVAWREALNLPYNTDNPQTDAKPNFSFALGIDPTGGTNPNADSVIWGDAYHIYNGYVKQLEVEAVANSDTVTVFIESQTLWAFKHNDAYIDDAELVVVAEVKPRGEPREQYSRVYVLLPPTAGPEWAKAVIDARWKSDRWTVGASADDGGIGDLDYRTVIAVNPQLWPGDLCAWYAEHYPGVAYVPVEAATPAELAEKLRA
jgi:hypothetical protein